MRTEKLVHGFGVNDADYVIRPHGKMCPYYSVWSNMLERCYCEKTHKKQPTYKGCKVCPEWKSFMSFRSWMKNQDWKGKQLDKDLIGSGRIYSPQTCCFVESWLNNLFTDHRKARGDYPVGVHINHGRYVARLTVNGGQKYLGRFDCPKKAHQCYCEAKLKHVKNLMADYPDGRIKQAVLSRSALLYS